MQGVSDASGAAPTGAPDAKGESVKAGSVAPVSGAPIHTTSRTKSLEETTPPVHTEDDWAEYEKSVAAVDWTGIQLRQVVREEIAPVADGVDVLLALHGAKAPDDASELLDGTEAWS